MLGDKVMDKWLEWMQEHKILMTIAAVIMSATMVYAILLCLNENYIELNVADGANVEIEYGSGQELEPVEALYKGTIFNQKGRPIEVQVVGTVEYDKIGSYELTFSAAYGNCAKAATVMVEIKDTLPPVIELVSNPEYYTSPVGSYIEEGYTATDNHDGDLTAQVVAEQVDDKMIYRVTDSAGNEAVAERTIIYKDVIAPVISLKGRQYSSRIVGGRFSEPGFTATDECDGDITGNVEVEGSVNTQAAGTYTITYKVSDSAGNVTEIQRVIKILEPTNGDKVIYLTFDDGPCAYTERLLDILDRYNVKATFFVTGAYSDYYHMIGEAYRRGHTIGIHTFSHRYNEIYSSVDAYFEDFNKIKDIIVAQTGVEPWLVRFPGGTSNTVSRKYCSGIMSALAKEVTERGYTYCDWNVVSGDAGNTTKEQGVINYVINNCGKQNCSIVLQHDIKNFSIDAVDDIIEWGLENGYEFRAIDENTPIVQYAPKN